MAALAGMRATAAYIQACDTTQLVVWAVSVDDAQSRRRKRLFADAGQKMA